MSISFQNKTNSTNFLEQYTQSTATKSTTSTAIKSQKADTVKINNANKNKNRKNTKYAAIVFAGVTLGIIFFKRRKIATYFKDIFKNSVPNKTDIQNITDEGKPPEIINNTSIIPENVPTNTPKDGVVTTTENVSNIITNKYGEKVYQKLEGMQSQKEVYTSKIYELAKVKTPEMDLIGYSLSPKGLESKFIENLKDIPEGDIQIYTNICKDFAADILVTNKNILKSCKLDSNNNVIRTNLSNTLGLNPDGSQEHFGIIVDELSTFLDPNKNPQNAQVYARITRDDLISSLERVCSIEKKKLGYIDTLHDKSQVLNETKYLHIINGRKNFLQKVLTIAKNTEQGALPIVEYVEKIKNEAIIKTIEKANHYNTIKDIEHSIKNIENNETKAMLSQLLEKRINFLTAEKDNHTEITNFEIGKLLEKYTCKSYQPTEQEAVQINEKYGKYSTEFINALTKPVDNQKINAMTNIANRNNGKYLDFWTNNPEKMVVYINSNTITDEQLICFTDEAWDTVIGAYKSCFEKFDAEAIDAIIKYGGLGSYDAINGYLRFDNKIHETLKLIEEKANIDENSVKKLDESISYLHDLTEHRIFGIGKDFEDGKKNQSEICTKLKNISQILGKNEKLDSDQLIHIKEELNKLKSFVESLSLDCKVKNTIEGLEKNFMLSTDIEQKMLLRRNETTNCFESLSLGGENLAKLMSEAREKPELQEKILDYFNKSNASLLQPGFLSTSIYPYNTLAGDVTWNLKLGENVKYNYVSDIDHIFNGAGKETEAEILIHPGHKIKITDAKFENSKWKLSGIIY